MKTKVQMWGDSLAVRIPGPFAEEVGLQNETPVEMMLQDGKLVISRAGAASFTLKELLKGITPENIHGELNSGDPAGNEVW